MNKVIDGDTYKCKDSVFRLLGVDTPETFDTKTKQPTVGKQYFYGIWAKQYVQKLIENKYISVIKLKRDKYNRFVAKITYQNKDLSCLLIQLGLAVVRYIDNNRKSPFYYHDNKYIENLWELQQKAKQNQKGFWVENKFSLQTIFPNYSF